MKVSFKIIGRNIKAARNAAHLTQEQTAGRIGLSALHYGRIERGEREPSLKLLTQIAAALNTSIFSLLRNCILDQENHSALFKSPDPQTQAYGEYVLVLLDEYREQIRRYYEELKLKENALR